MAETQVGDGDKGLQGDKTTVIDGATPVTAPPKKEEPKDPVAPQYVTPEILTGVLDATKRSTAEEFRKMGENQRALQETINKLATALEEKSKVGDKDGDKKKEPEKESAELVELRRTAAAQLAEIQSERDRASGLEQDKRDMQFDTTVRTSLEKAGCLDISAALLVIRPHLKQSEDGARVFSTVKSQFGDADVELAEFISRTFSEDICPYLFKGKFRPGSPAGGDAGSGGGGYTYTAEELLGKNPELYIKDPEKARAALESGGVKGFKKGS